MATNNLCQEIKNYEGKSLQNKNRTKSYIVGRMFGRGGEGGVFPINGDSSLAAKIFKYELLSDDVKRKEKEEKIRAMIAKPLLLNSPDGTPLIAWPQDALYCNDIFVGYIMPKVRSRGNLSDVEILDFRDRLFPSYTWRNNLNIALNYALIVDYVHEMGYVIGDMNSNNILIQEKEAPVLIDTDSFAVTTAGGKKFSASEVGMMEYVAPELQKTSKLEYTRLSDDFSLAVHIFVLLMMGYHPFEGTLSKKRASSSATRSEKIAKGLCPFVKGDNCGVKKNEAAPDFNALPKNIQALFIRAFGYNENTRVSEFRSERPSAKEWVQELTKVREKRSNFVVCTKTKKHEYLIDDGQPSSCPWCEADKRRARVAKETLELLRKQQNQSNTDQGNKTNVNTPQKITIVNPVPVFSHSSSTYHTPTPFYVVLCVVGLISGIYFGNSVCLFINNQLNVNISSGLTSFLLAIVGLACGGVIAYLLSDRYEDSHTVWPWYLIGLAMPFVTYIVGVVLSCVLYIAFYLIILAIGFAVCSGG